MNGARGRSNNFLLDGTDMNDGYRNDPAINQAGVFGTPATILPVDAVAELAVLSNFAPEYGRNAGGVINIVTKSGTNQIHGTAANYFRNDALDARNFFNTAPTPKTAFHNNQFGGSLGGPIVKDKAFFFGDYEGQRETGGLNSTACVPSANNIAQAESAAGRARAQRQSRYRRAAATESLAGGQFLDARLLRHRQQCFRHRQHLQQREQRHRQGRLQHQ